MSDPARRIRPALHGDLPAVRSLIDHFIVHSAANFKLAPLTADEAESWFAQFSESGRYRIRVAEGGGGTGGGTGAAAEGAIAGFACTVPFHPRAAYATSVMASIYIHPSHHRLGLGAALYSALFASLHGEPIHRIYAGITLPNPPSIALHTRFGFRQVGHFHEAGHKFGTFHDVIWMEKPFP
ncbi:GNAT family N-acetyltransferase [soil metagenome]